MSVPARNSIDFLGMLLKKVCEVGNSFRLELLMENVLGASDIFRKFNDLFKITEKIVEHCREPKTYFEDNLPLSVCDELNSLNLYFKWATKIGGNWLYLVNNNIEEIVLSNAKIFL